MTIIGYSTTPGSSNTLTAGSSEQTRLNLDATDYIAQAGDTVTQVNLYVAGGDGTTTTNVQIGVYSGGTRTNPAAGALLFSVSLPVTAAMKLAPGWYNTSVSWNIGASAGAVIRVAYAAADVGSIAIGADSGVGASSVNSGVHVLPNPYGQTTYGSTNLAGLYATVTPGGGLASAATETTSATGSLGLKHVVADLTLETTTTTGTSPFSLGGAVTGFRSFGSVMSDQDTCLYMAQAVTAGVPNGPWEVGIGTFNASGDTLSRTQVLKSSNANAAVVFAAGTTNVALTEPSAVLWNKGVFNAGLSGSAITIDWSNGRYQMLTLTANCTITFANSMLCPEGVLEIYQDPTGGRVPTLTGAVYRSGSAPTWSTTNATHDTLRVRYNAVTGKSNVFAET
jgi:hypothetical protein